MGRGSPSFDGKRWPSGQHIQDVLVHWHQAKQALNGAWNALSQDQQSAMKPPPFYRP